MATLEELLDIEGVVAAGEFGRDGSLVDFEARMDMSEEMAQMTAQFCATVTMMFDTLAGSFTQLSGMNWVPQQGSGRTPAGNGRCASGVTEVSS